MITEKNNDIASADSALNGASTKFSDEKIIVNQSVNNVSSETKRYRGSGKHDFDFDFLSQTIQSSLSGVEINSGLDWGSQIR